MPNSDPWDRFVYPIHKLMIDSYILAQAPFLDTVKPVLSDYIKLSIFLAFQTGGCLLLNESSAESSCMSFLHYFHSAISNHLSTGISM